MKTIYLKDHGILPNTGIDYTSAIAEVFAYYLSDTIFIFETGRYDFCSKNAIIADYRLSNSVSIPQRKLGLLLKNMQNIVLDGCMSSLMFAGHMQPISIDNCINVTVENFVIDWDKPLVAEGTVVANGEKFSDIWIDKNSFPCTCHDDWLYFDIGAGESYPLCQTMEYDINNYIVPNGDNTIFPHKVEEIDKDTYRFYYRRDYSPRIGNLIVLRHNARYHAGLFAENSTDVTFRNMTIHSDGGLGILAQFCKDVTCVKIDFIPNTARGRKVSSGRDDGMQISNCSGVTTIEECTFLGLMDDPINVHGTYIHIIEIVDKITISCEFTDAQPRGFSNWAKKGDVVSFIDRTNMSSIGMATVERYDPNEYGKYTLVFQEDIPQNILMDIGLVLVLENITNATSLICRNNMFMSCRARGILISTPKSVLVEHNIFESSGSAILIAGDATKWYESGECNDVTIRNNIFTDHCLSSMYQYCEAIISICPTVAEPKYDLPFHKNIRIYDNLFHSSDVPVLYAFSTQYLTFENNRIFRSWRYKKWHKRNYLYNFAWCKNVNIRNNSVFGCFTLGEIYTENMDSISPYVSE